MSQGKKITHSVPKPCHHRSMIESHKKPAPLNSAHRIGAVEIITITWSSKISCPHSLVPSQDRYCIAGTVHGVTYYLRLSIRCPCGAPVARFNNSTKNVKFPKDCELCVCIPTTCTKLAGIIPYTLWWAQPKHNSSIGNIDTIW